MLWYEEEIKRLESLTAGSKQESRLVFYGSSSIKLWDTLEEDFKGYAPLNRGFGGSTLAACSWFFERVFANLRPSGIIIYAGDNDLGDGRNPEEVLLFFNAFLQFVRNRFGDIHVGFIAIKPSIKRWGIVDKIRDANHLIESFINKSGDNISFINIYDQMTDEKGYPKSELLELDGLHINKKGYQLWKEIILERVSKEKLQNPKK
jgi:lysophospholipase L1-like esterase